MDWNNPKIIKILKGNGIVVMPTDTLYGIVGRALDTMVVERIYEARKRAPEKPCIILIGDIDQLNEFTIKISTAQKKILEKYWSFDKTQDFQPGPTSIVLDCLDEKLEYLHRGTRTLAFRIPDIAPLRDLLLEVGPLIAPSANLEGMSPAQNINEAKKYFGDLVDLYIDGGTILGQPSKVVRLYPNGSESVLRA